VALTRYSTVASISGVSVGGGEVPRIAVFIAAFTVARMSGIGVAGWTGPQPMVRAKISKLRIVALLATSISG
jgi:hypothetical protein